MTRETIARYEIQSELGRGGMATVYLAYDPNFRRKVAIKLISGNLQENSAFRERFEREAHLIAKIEHPAIVPVYDYGEEGNQLYLVMRYMPGGALTNKIKEGVLTLGYATEIISQVAPALDAVHSQGIVHRDLKPGNILLDSFGNPAISDFGIAHFTAATTDLTGSAVIGTPSYMSPEQVRADADLDGRSDIYALGVILFEMLTGRGPFQANTPMSVALKHLTDPLPSILTFRSNLPMELESILDKAMAKDREMRYASASDLASALRAIPDTAQENSTHPKVPVILPRNEEVSTEVDMAENAETPGGSSASSHASSPGLVTHQTLEPESVGTSPRQAAGIKKPLNRTLKYVAIAGIAAVLLFLCGSIGVLGTWAGLILPGLFPGRTVPPTQAPTDAGIPPDNILLSDDFSDPNSGWPAIQNSQGGYRYGQDGYHIHVDEMDAVLWAITNRQDADASISVHAMPVSEGSNGYYGLLCRVQNDQNFYYFVIQSNGNYTIGKYKNAEFQSLFSDGWRGSDAIQQGDQPNRLRADCDGNTLRLYVNNVLLGEVTDADFSSGFSGMIAAALDTQGIEVVFNNFLITQPSQ